LPGKAARIDLISCDIEMIDAGMVRAIFWMSLERDS